MVGSDLFVFLCSNGWFVASRRVVDDNAAMAVGFVFRRTFSVCHRSSVLLSFTGAPASINTRHLPLDSFTICTFCRGVVLPAGGGTLQQYVRTAADSFVCLWDVAAIAGSIVPKM